MSKWEPGIVATGEQAEPLAQYRPDYGGFGEPSIFIQWKGTDVCLDFYCTCGRQGHFDGYFAYAVRCSLCGKVWELPHTVRLVEAIDYDGVVQEPDMDEQDW